MGKMDYLIGMLWARGYLNIEEPSMTIEIGIRDVSQWQIDLLRVLKTGERSSEELLAHPRISVYRDVSGLTSETISNFLRQKTQLKIPIVRKQNEKWKIIDVDRFDQFLAQKEYDKENFKTCSEQIRQLQQRLRRDFRVIRPAYGRIEFNIRTHDFQIGMDPILMERLVSDYNLPRGPGEQEMYWRMSSVPTKILHGNKEEMSDFLRGVADVCGSLEGNTPRGRDARIKFDLLNNIVDENKYRATVQKSVNLCNFIQDQLEIPVQGNYISLRNNPRPHKLKIWIKDLETKFQRPLWYMKIHYQQRLNEALSRLSMPFGRYCPSAVGSNSTEGLRRYLHERRETPPSMVRCLRYCTRLQNKLLEESLMGLRDLISSISREFERKEGVKLP